MKKKNLLLLSLVSLSLVGCFENTSDSNKTSANSNSIVNSDKTSISTKPSTTSKDTTDKGSSTKSDTTTDTTSSDKEDDIYTQTEWPLSIAKVMYKKLDKRFVPYVDLKPTKEAKLIGSWSLEKSTYTIISDYSSLSTSMIEEAKQTYETAGWTTAVEDASFTATNAENDLTVTLKLEDEVLTFTIKFDEKFDATKVSAWDDDLLAELNQTYKNHGADIPFVYLGTINPELNESSYGGTYEINGGIWDDSIKTIFQTAFENANASISGDNKWVVEEDYSDVVATRTLDDGCKFKITLSNKSSYDYATSTSSKTPYLSIIYYPVFNPSSSTLTDWPSEVLDYFNTNLEGHRIPYFYIGSDNINTYPYSESENTKTFLGDSYTWDDQIFSLAEAAINKENLNLEDEYKWKKVEAENYDGSKIYTFTKDYSDGCKLSFELKNSGEYAYERASIYIKYSPKYTVPEGAKWSDDILSKFQQYFGTQDIPYIYLGSDDYISTSWNAPTKSLTITGGNYYPSLLVGATNTFTSALGWNGQVETVTTQEYSQEYTYQKYVATKTIDTENDKKLTVEVEGSLHGTYYTDGTDGNAQLKITLNEPFTPPTGEDASWDKYTYKGQKVSDIITDKLDGHTIPYVYLNVTDVTTYYSGDKIFYITGGIWDDAVLTHAKSQFEAATGWTDINVDNTNKEFTAKCELEDGCKMNVLIHKNKDGYIEYKTTIDFAFKEMTAWSTDAETIMKQVLNGHVLPIVQSGSANPEIYNYSDTVIISNNNWKEGLLEETSTKLTAESWNCFIDNNIYQTYYQRLNVYKEFDDGIVYFYVANTSYGFYLEASFLKKPTTQTQTVWNTAEKANIDAITENQTDTLVPFLYMGEGTYEVNANKKIYGTELSTYSVIKYYETLKSLGYTDFHIYFTQNGSVEFNATHTDANGNVITITVDSQGQFDEDWNYVYVLVFEVTYTKASTSEAE